MPEPSRAKDSFASPLPTGAWLGLVALLVLVALGQGWSLHTANVRIDEQDRRISAFDDLQKKVDQFEQEKQAPNSLCAMAIETQKQQLLLLKQCNETAGKAAAAAKTFHDQLVQCEQTKHQ
jgi:Tfp pilus assembly protein PilN